MTRHSPKRRSFVVLVAVFLLTYVVWAQTSLQVGYVVFTADTGTPLPVGSALFSYKNSSGVLVSEAGVGATEPILRGRAFVDEVGTKTGIALVNSSQAAATVTLILRDASGAEVARRTDTLAAGQHMPRYVADLFPNQTTGVRGSLSFESNQPLAAVTLRESRNGYGEPVYATVPVINLNAGAPTDAVVFPQIAAGGGYTTEILLLNTGADRISGQVSLFASNGQPLSLPTSQIPYQIEANGTFRAQLDAAALNVGWATAIPSSGSRPPAGSIIFRYKSGSQLVSEGGVAATPSTPLARIFVDNAGTHTGVALVNPSDSTAQVTFKLLDRSGNVQETVSRTLAANNHLPIYANDLFSTLTEGFTGLMEIQSSVPVVAVAVKLTFNTRGDMVITTLPVADLTRPSAATAMVFPQIAIGAEFSTRLIFVNGNTATTSSGQMAFYKSDGSALTVPMGSDTGSRFPFRVTAGGGRQFYPGNTAQVSAVMLMDISSNAETSELVINEGNTIRPRVRVVDRSGQGRDDFDVSYSTTNGDIAVVNTDGSITAKQAGFSSFTLSSGGTVATGTITVVRVDSGTLGFGTVGVVQDLAQRLYLASSDHTILLAQDVRQTPATYAGIPKSPGLKDDLRLQSQFRYPAFLAINQAEGSLFVTDSANHVIRRVKPGESGRVETIAGSGSPGSKDGSLLQASFNAPQGIALDRRGNLWVADTGNHTIRRINVATGVVETVAGTAGSSGSADGKGTAAQFKSPAGIAVEIESTVQQLERERRGEPPPTVSVIVADTGNGVLRRVTDDGNVETLRAAAPRTSMLAERRMGQALTAGLPFTFTSPTGITVDGFGNIYVTETAAGRVRVLLSSRDEVVTAAQGNTFSQPLGLSAGSTGAVVVADGAYGAQQVSFGGPRITGVTPSRISDQGGTPVTITGSNFARDSVLLVGGTVISTAVVRNTETISFTAPPLGSGGTTITVQNRGGLGQASLLVDPVSLNALAPGYVTTVAGGTTFEGDGGLAQAAHIGNPHGVAIDSTGAVYIADRDSHKIRRIDPRTGIINTVAGNGQKGSSGDFGLATAAQLNAPVAVAIDLSGNILIADSNNNRIRKVDAVTGIITTAAGGGIFGRLGDGSPATSAYLSSPQDVSVDSAGNFYIVDQFNQRIRKVDGKTGIITTIAGNGTSGFSGDGGPATAAQFFYPTSVAVDKHGNVYVADGYNYRIRKIDAASGTISTFAGNGTIKIDISENVPALTATIASAQDLFIDADNNVYIADIRLRKITAATGLINTVAGGGLQQPTSVAVPPKSVTIYANSVAIDAAGNLFITDTLEKRVHRIAATTGLLSAAVGANSSVGDNGAATAATLTMPTGVAFDAAGNLLIADSQNNRLRRLDASTGTITTIAGTGVYGAIYIDSRAATTVDLGGPRKVRLDRAGNIYVATYTEILKITAGSGIMSELAGTWAPTRTRIRAISGFVVDGDGNAYFADEFDNRVSKVSTSGVVTTIAGNGTAGFSGDGGPATSASLDMPWGLALDASGNLYISDRNNRRVRKVTLSTGVITTYVSNLFYPTDIIFDLTGNLLVLENATMLTRVTPSGQIQVLANPDFTKSGFSGDNKPAFQATFYYPDGLTLDASGNIFIADSYNNRIRAIKAPVP